MQDALKDPADAVPASTATALHALDPEPADGLAAIFAAMSTSARGALATADELRRRAARDAVGLEHHLLGLWARENGLTRRAFDRAGWTADGLREFLAAQGADAPNAADIRHAQAVTGAAVRAGTFALPPVDAAVSDALHAAARIAGDGATRRGVHARHLLAGLLAAPAGRLAPLFERVRRDVIVVLRETIDAEIAAGRLDPDSAAREQTETDRLWSAAARNDADLADGAREKEERAAEDAPPTTASEQTSSPTTGVGGGAGNDRAEGTDRLNFEHYIRAFADLIDSPDTKPPLTIGIFGAWGAGKSFILRGITSELARRAAAARPTLARSYGRWLRRVVLREPRPTRQRAHVYTVAFNAWEYNAAEHIWPRLVRRVLDEVTRDAQWHRRPLRWTQTLGRKLYRNFWRKLASDWKSLVAWLAIGAALWWGWTRFGPDTAVAFTKRVLGVDASDEGFSAPAIVGGLVAAVKLLIDTLLAPLGGWVTALLDDGPGYGGESDFVRTVRADLDLVDRQLGAEGGRVLVVVDDLDRCEPNKAVEVLQAINLLLDRRTFVVCLGIDARVITAAVEKHYEELLGPAGITGYEYLDKIVQIPFRIPEPTPTDVARFVAGQLGGAPPPEETGTPADTRSNAPADASPAKPADDPVLDALATIGEATRDQPRVAAAIELAARTAANPVARAVMDQESVRLGIDATAGFLTPPPPVPEQLSFTRDEHIAFAEVAQFLRANPRHLKRLVNVYALVRSLALLGGARTLLDAPRATVRWLTLCAQWPYAVRAMLEHLDATEPPGDASPPLRWLLDATRDSLDPAKRRKYDHDEAVLERLVAASDVITWQHVGVLRRYTVNFNPALDAELRVDGGRRPPVRVRRPAREPEPAAESGPAPATHQPYDRRRA